MISASLSSKKLPDEITSYDLLKTFAVLTMVIDHIGIYFFPDDMTWRAVGRTSAPVWMFLIGYAQSRDIPGKLWGGALILVAATFTLGAEIFPLNILVTILLVRLVLDKAVSYLFTERARCIAGYIVLLLLVPLTYPAFEYGAMALLLALYGYMIRHKSGNAFITDDRIVIFGLTTAILYIGLEYLAFGFAGIDNMIITGGVLAVFVMLYGFKPATFKGFTQKCPKLLTLLLQLCGRRTLEIYVAHLVLFKIIAWQLGMEGYGLFEWKWLVL